MSAYPKEPKEEDYRSYLFPYRLHNKKKKKIPSNSIFILVLSMDYNQIPISHQIQKLRQLILAMKSITHGNTQVTCKSSIQLSLEVCCN